MIKISKHLKLKKWDNCYTFFLKFFDIFDQLKDLDSEDFLKIIQKEIYIESTKLQDLDVLIFYDKDKNINDRIIRNGYKIINSTYTRRIHFVIYREHKKEKIFIDLTYNERENFIRKRFFNDVDLFSYNKKIWLLTLVNLEKSIKKYETNNIKR